ncbi:MAG: hypothetical protein CSA58_04425 [Micrococcales bacterium]|nr:MAG: hypothetical protein CSA58_04425 [Micrococcales bacterium]
MANNASVAVLVRVRQTSVLLLGDLEPAAQRELTGQLDRFGVDTIDIVKVAHHGSRFQHQPLYEQLDPRIALVSAGADNDYGHPAPGLVADLAADGAVIARTDTDGMTLVGAQGEQLWVHRSS